jgi:hypothetical protein
MNTHSQEQDRGEQAMKGFAGAKLRAATYGKESM